MNQKTIEIKGLLLTGIDAVAIPSFAIIGVVSIGAAMTYGVYKLSKKFMRKHDELEKSIKEFTEFVKKHETES